MLPSVPETRSHCACNIAPPLTKQGRLGRCQLPHSRLALTEHGQPRTQSGVCRLDQAATSPETGATRSFQEPASPKGEHGFARREAPRRRYVRSRALGLGTHGQPGEETVRGATERLHGVSSPPLKRSADGRTARGRVRKEPPICVPSVGASSGIRERAGRQPDGLIVRRYVSSSVVRDLDVGSRDRRSNVHDQLGLSARERAICAEGQTINACNVRPRVAWRRGR